MLRRQNNSTRQDLGDRRTIPDDTPIQPLHITKLLKASMDLGVAELNIRRLVDSLHSSNIEITDPNYISIIETMAERHRLDVFDLSQQAGAALNLVNPLTGQNLLHHFAKGKSRATSSEILDRLIEAGCTLNAQDLMGATPLHIAVLSLSAQSESYDITKSNPATLLLARGANRDLRDNSHFTPKDYALASGHPGICRIFEDHERDLSPNPGATADSTPPNLTEGGLEVHQELLRQIEQIRAREAELTRAREDILRDRQHLGEEGLAQRHALLEQNVQRRQDALVQREFDILERERGLEDRESGFASQAQSDTLEGLHTQISSNIPLQHLTEAIPSLALGDLHKKHTDGYSILERAALMQRKDVLEYFKTTHHIALATIFDPEHNNLIHYWARGEAPTGTLESLKYLIQEGCSVNEANNEGKTPLHTAGGSGIRRNVILLLRNGADHRIQDSNEETPREFALASRQDAVLRAFDELLTPPAIDREEHVQAPPRPALAAPKPHISGSLYNVYLRIDTNYGNQENQPPPKKGFFSSSTKPIKHEPKYTDKCIGQLPYEASGVLTDKYTTDTLFIESFLASATYVIHYTMEGGTLRTKSIELPNGTRYTRSKELGGRMILYLSTEPIQHLTKENSFEIPASGALYCLKDKTTAFWAEELSGNCTDKLPPSSYDHHDDVDLAGAAAAY